MKLADYLEQHNLTDQAFADLIPVDRSTVTRWRAGQPPKDMAQWARIVSATGGAVTPNDFLPAAAESKARGGKDKQSKSSTLVKRAA